MNENYCMRIWYFLQKNFMPVDTKIPSITEEEFLRFFFILSMKMDICY